MALSAEEMAEVERLLAPGSGISDEVRTQLLQRRSAMQDEHLSRSVPAPAPSGAELKLNNSLSLLPQALAVMPASTHPGGDQAAEAEFKATGGASAKGSVFVYDVPLQQAKKDLLENPEKVRALYPNLPPEEFVTPEEIMAMDHDSDIMRTYQDKAYLDTAAAAAERGLTAHRYSKTPWLQGDGAMTTMQKLGLKLDMSGKPIADGITTFVMGVDNIASFGAARAAHETADALFPDQPAAPLTGADERDFYMHPTLGKTPKSMQPKDAALRVGGVTDPSLKERNAQLEEENPFAYFGGQALAALRGWGVAGALFNRALGVAGEGAQMLGGGLAARMGTGTAGGMLGASAVQGAQDAVTLGANALQGDEAPFTGSEVPSRMAHAAGVAAPFAAGGAAVQSLAGAGADKIRWGNRYDGKVGNLERDVKDMEFRTLRGPRSKSIEKLKVDARKADKDPGGMLAREVAPKVSAKLEEDLDAVFPQVDKQKREFISSNEGKQKLPVRNLTEKAVEKLRHHMESHAEGGVPDPVGLPGAGNEVKQIFNQEITGVSLSPVPGAISLSPEEAEAFLVPLRHKELIRSRPGKAPKVAPGAEPRRPGALEPPAQLRVVGGTEAPPPWLVPKDPHPMLNKGGRAELEKLSRRYEPGKKIPREEWDEYIEGLRARQAPDYKHSEGGLTGEQIALIRQTVEGFGQQPGHVAKGGLDAAIDRLAEDPRAVMRDRNATAVPRKFLKERMDQDTGVPGAPESVANVPARRTPNMAPEATQRFGAKDSIKGRKPPPPEPKKPPMRVSGPGRAEAEESSGSLAQTLRSRGVDQVYVVPRRHDAEHHEALLKTIAGYRERNPSDKDLADLDLAARVDRDARPLGGKPGGWSALQNRHSELIERGKVAKQLGGGDDSFKVLTSYGRGSKGEDPTKVDLLRDVADRAGVREQLDKIRSLDPYEDLARQSRFEQSRAQPHPPGKIKSTGDFLGVRAFPALRALEGPLGVGARGGRAANVGRDEAVKEKRKHKQDRKNP
jgi:hypothetical protein